MVVLFVVVVLFVFAVLSFEFGFWLLDELMVGFGGFGLVILGLGLFVSSCGIFRVWFCCGGWLVFWFCFVVDGFGVGGMCVYGGLFWVWVVCLFGWVCLGVCGGLCISCYLFWIIT